jgi:hypothetical protein
MDALYGAYRDWLRDRRHHGDLLGQVTFGHKLVPLVPDRKRVQQRVGKSRVWRYVLPPLAACRAAFETWIGAQIDWSGDDDDSDILELL